MNELKPEDVMRALECCNVGSSCEGCAYEREPIPLCRYHMVEDIRALLREKDAEIEHCRMLFKAVKLGKTKLEDENEMLKAEIERLKTREKVLTQMLDDGYNEWEDYVRADAITEFENELYKVVDDTYIERYIAEIAEKMKGETE